jgi:hypothetical protein
MDKYEELLIKAWSCLSEAHKIEDPALRGRVVDLAYSCQLLAQTAILDQLPGKGMDSEKPEQSR